MMMMSKKNKERRHDEKYFIQALMHFIAHFIITIIIIIHILSQDNHKIITKLTTERVQPEREGWIKKVGNS